MTVSVGEAKFCSPNFNCFKYIGSKTKHRNNIEINIES